LAGYTRAARATPRARSGVHDGILLGAETWRIAMNTFYEHHENSIRFAYRCFDRILINGLIQPFQQPERVVGFFNTYRQLYPVSRLVLRGIATQYQRWVEAQANTWAAPRSVQQLDRRRLGRSQAEVCAYPAIESTSAQDSARGRNPAAQ
jgi:hypothetical protein